MAQSKLTKLSVLRSESAADFAALRERLRKEIKPKGVIEEIYLEDIAHLVWDIQRLRNFKISTIHQAYGPALRSLLEQLLFKPVLLEGMDTEVKASVLADGWLENDAETKKEVRDILRRFDLDESAIEAEAMKLTVDHLQYLDRSLVTASGRLDKALRLVMEYRSGIAKRLRQQSDQILHEVEPAQQAA